MYQRNEASDQRSLTVVRPVEQQHIVDMWLRGKAVGTVEYYSRVVRGLLYKPMQDIGLDDMQAYVDSLPHGSQAKAVAAIKSLWTFSLKLGILQLNPAALLHSPKANSDLAKRILPEDSVIALIDAIPVGRNHCIVRLLYHAGLRVSELCALQWEDVHDYGDFVVLSILGKGGKRRNVRISCDMYDEMVSQIDSGVYVFTSRKNGGAIQRRQVGRIVHDAGLTIDVDRVSPHWFRHCNASHALDNGATVPEVQQSLGHSSIVITQRYLHMKPGSGSSQYIKI